MIRKLGMAVAAGALAVAGLAVVGVGGAGAAGTVTIVGGAGSSIHCTTLKAKTNVAPALKDNWVKSEHASDPNVAVQNLPNTTYASNGPVSVSGTISISGCTGTVKQGTNAAAVKKITTTLAVDPAHAGNATPATCAALIAGTPSDNTSTRYILKSTYKSGTKGFLIADTTLSNVNIVSDIASAGFRIKGAADASGNPTPEVITGSFGGGNITALAQVDSKTITAFVSADGLHQVASNDTNPKGAKPCQAKLKAKAATGGAHPKPASASISAPKGITKIGIGSGTFDATR